MPLHKIPNHEIPVNQMHQGEELLYILIPAFVVLMIVDMAKRRKIRRRQMEEPLDEKGPEDESSEPPSP